MSFDLNITNYKKKELIDMFDLPQTYDKNILEVQETKLKTNIMNNNKINLDTKTKTINFLKEAKKILMEDIIEISHDIKNSFEKFYNSRLDLKPVNVDDETGHMLQERKTPPYLSSYPSDFFPGIINPLKKRINRQNLNIDTRFRENYYSSQSTDYHLDLPIKLSNILSMQLTSIEVPTTFYTISKQLGNNYFVITIDNTSEIITIPNGNYTNESLIDYINNYFTNNLSGSFTDIYFALNISSSSGSGNIIAGIKSTSSSLFNFTLNFQTDKFGQEDRYTPLPLKFGWLLGYRNGVYVNNSSYVSEGIIDLYGPKYIYLVIDDFNNNVNNSFYSAFNSSLLNKNILARISLQGINFSVFTENNLSIVTFPRQYFGPVDIQKMNIQLLDEYGRILDLNNMDYSFCLTFQTTYDI
jgi:hypothetical protein